MASDFIFIADAHSFSTSDTVIQIPGDVINGNDLTYRAESAYTLFWDEENKSYKILTRGERVVCFINHDNWDFMQRLLDDLNSGRYLERHARSACEHKNKEYLQEIENIW